jgi:hypothetical protein
MTVALNPDLQAQVDRVEAFMAERGWIRSDLARAIYGDSGDGRGAKNSSLITHIASGRHQISRYTAGIWRDRVGLDLTDLATDWMPTNGTPPRGGRAAAAVAAYQAEQATSPALTLHPVAVPRRQGPPRLAMQINGPTGNLAFTMHDAPAAEILRAFQVLQAADLIEERETPHDDATG